MKNLKNLDWESFDQGVYLPKEKKKNKKVPAVVQSDNLSAKPPKNKK